MKKKIVMFILLVTIFSGISQNTYAESGDEIEKEAEENAKNTVPLTDGAIYENIRNICPDALLYALYKEDNTLTVDLTDFDSSGGINLFSHRFMKLAAYILGQCDVESEFKNVNFVYAKNENVISLQISKFENIGDFTANLWCIADDKTTEWMNTYYNNIFGRHDLQYKLDMETNELMRKYGGEVKDLDVVNNDELWMDSAFQDIKGYKNENEGLEITVCGFELTNEGGNLFKKAVLKAQKNYIDIFNSENVSLSFRNFKIICVEFKSGKEIVSVTFTTDENNTIAGRYSSCSDTAFAEGISQ